MRGEFSRGAERRSLFSGDFEVEISALCHVLLIFFLRSLTKSYVLYARRVPHFWPVLPEVGIFAGVSKGSVKAPSAARAARSFVRAEHQFLCENHKTFSGELGS